MKYAELPGGKILKFADGVSDKEMQRAVRRELGLGNDDLLAALEGFSDKLEVLLEASKEAQTRHREAIAEIADALNANASRTTSELFDAIRDMSKLMQRHHDGLNKIMSTQANLMVKLDTGVAALNKTLDAALGESLASMEEGHASTKRNATSMEKSTTALGALVQRLSQAIEEFAAARKVKRRAYRERDGSWTMETIG